MLNLDMHAAREAQFILGKIDEINSTRAADKKLKMTNVENVVTKALGVIQEQGVYAGMLYLLSRPDKEKPIAEATWKRLVELLKAVPFNLTEGLAENPTSQQLLDHFATKVCGAPIHTLLLVKNLFEQTLMYARYSAKARPDESDNQPTPEV